MSPPTPSDPRAAGRLQVELQRLYLPHSAGPSNPPTDPPHLHDAHGHVRALVMQAAQPPGWDALAAVWRGVQADLDLPAPAVAVSGSDGLQLWFSLADAVPVEAAHAFLDALRARFVPEVEPRRLRLLPAAGADDLSLAALASALPVRQVQPGQWSAFVAPDLAPVFADTPWLDGPPNEEGQASLLRGLASITPADWAQALARLAPPAALAPAPPAPPSEAVHAMPPSPAPPADDSDPRSFLLRVMNDPGVDLALRIQAASALLQHDVARRPPSGG